ncbi:transposase [Microvenator marinus]|uniref:Transposase n=1 Tax=Microvenator marinus TaxID=2600177 RepID=A0A5B8XTT3_9DELT|nr:transposase [Microvenator marinus]
MYPHRVRRFKVTKKIKQYRRFTDSFKADAVRLVEEQGLSVAQVSRDLGINANSLYNWVNASREASSSGLSTDEAAELERLRKEVKVLREEREILKKAAAFFAKESK